MSTRSLLTFVGFAVCLLLNGCDNTQPNVSNNESPAVNRDTNNLTTTANSPASAPKSLRDQIIAAVGEEIPNARIHFGAHPIGTNVNENLLTDDDVLKVAEGVLTQTKRDKLFSSSAVSQQQGEVLVSVSSLSLEEDSWQQALVRFQGAQFDRISEHYAKQAAEADRQSLTDVQGFVHLYLGLKKGGDVVAAIGICGVSGSKQLKPRQFPDTLQDTRNDATIALKNLPSKRCDVDTEGELVLPGEGFLLSAAEVSKSQLYWDSLSPQTRVVMRQAIRTDTSPWLVSEKHIGKFNVNKTEARQRAVEMWNKELKSKSR